MSKKVADGIKNGSGLWKHGHTYQVTLFSSAEDFLIQVLYFCRVTQLPAQQLSLFKT